MSLLSIIPVHAQLFIGNEIGFDSYDVRDDLVSPFRFENIESSLINLHVFYESRRSKISVSFRKNDIRLERLEENESNFMEGQNYELNIEYLRKVYEINDRLSVFIGPAHNGHFSYFDHVFRTPFVNSEQSTHEMTAANLSINGLVEYQVKKAKFQYKFGTGVLSYGTRPENDATSGDFYFGWQNYFSIQNSVNGLIPISKRFFFKPEFRLKYYTYSNPEQFKLLKQSFLMGVYIRL